MPKQEEAKPVSGNARRRTILTLLQERQLTQAQIAREVKLTRSRVNQYYKQFIRLRLLHS